MKAGNHSIRCATPALCAAVLILLSAVPGANGPKFFPDDPVWEEPDTQDASNVRSREIDLIYDTAENLFASPGDPRRMCGRRT